MDYQNPIPRVLKHPLRVNALLQLTLYWLRTYFTTQQQLRDAHYTVVERDVDDRIPAEGSAVYPYLFACVFVMYTAWTVLDRLSTKQYKRTRSAFKMLIKESQRVFLARPTRMRNRDRSDHPLLRYTQEIDGPTNCFPSLHISISTLAYQILKDTAIKEGLAREAMRRSYVDICRSTLKTKQHAVIDVVGGLEQARRIYEHSFEGDYEDLSGELLPELSVDEWRGVERACQASPDLETLLARLLDLFPARAS